MCQFFAELFAPKHFFPKSNEQVTKMVTINDGNMEIVHIYQIKKNISMVEYVETQAKWLAKAGTGNFIYPINQFCND